MEGMAASQRIYATNFCISLMELYINTFATFKEGEGYYEAEIRGTEYLMREYLIKYQE